MSRTYYTLRKRIKGDIREEIYPIEFDTYEEAYDHMVLIYMNQKFKGKTLDRWGIWETSENDYGGNHNSMTQPVWK